MFLLVLAGPVASAQEPDAVDVARAQRLVSRGKFEAALRILKPKLKTSSVLRVSVLTAVCLVALRQEEEAETALIRALDLDPELELNPAEYNPRVIAVFFRAKSQVLGELEVPAAEPALQIFEGTQLLGAAPLRLRMTVGRHSLRLVNIYGERPIEVVVKGNAVFKLSPNQAPQKPVEQSEISAIKSPDAGAKVKAPALVGLETVASSPQVPAWKSKVRYGFLIAGIVSAAAAGVLFGISADRFARLDGQRLVFPSRAEADAYGQTGQREQWIAGGLAGFAGACLLTFTLLSF